MNAKRMNNIDIYNNSAIILYRKTPNRIISWISILIIILVMLFILFLIPFNIYKNYDAYVTIMDNDSYLNLFLEKSDFPINKKNKLYIKRDLYNYEIDEIKESEVKLKVNLKEDIKIQGNYIRVNILYGKTTIFNLIINTIKKGFSL